MMDYRKKLDPLIRTELVRKARDLGIGGAYNLTKEELVEEILKRPKKEINRVLCLDWWHRNKKLVLYIGLFGALASIIALLYAIWTHQKSQKAARTFDKRLLSVEHTLETKIADPAAVSRLKEEHRKIQEALEEKHKKKLESLQKTIAELEGLQDKEKNEALEAIKKGDYTRAKELFKAIIEKKSKEAAFAHYKLGDIAFLEIKYKAALDYYLEAESLDPENALYKNEIGFVYDTLGKYRQAIEYYEKANEISIKNHGEGHPYVATTWNNLGAAWQALGEYRKAIGYYEQALASDLKTYGQEHPDVAIDWNNLGAAWKALGEYRKAIEYYEKALASDLKTYGEGHPNVARDWNNLGGAWDALGEYQKAIGYYEQALAVFQNNLGDAHPNVATLWNNLGAAWYALKEYQKAIEYYEKALASDLKTFGKGHPDVATDWNNLGAACYAMGEYKKAVDYFEKSLKVREKFLGKDHPWTKGTREYLEMAREKLAQ